jgi:hypothetical protein
MQDSGGHPQENGNTSCHAKFKKWVPGNTANLIIPTLIWARQWTLVAGWQFFGFFIRPNAVNYQ